MTSELSFDELYSAYSGKLYRFSLRLCGNREDAEDLAAETFGTALQNWGRYRGDAHISTWLFGIALNRWRTLRRKKAFLPARGFECELVAQTFIVEDLALAQAIARLPRPLREAFLLVKGEGFSHAEAGKIQGVPTGTVSFRVSRAMNLLRAELEPERYPKVLAGEVTCES